MAELYAIEQQAKDWDARARAALRQLEAKPRLEAWHAWLIGTRLTVADNSGSAGAGLQPEALACHQTLCGKWNAAHR